jgi:hypothetical protein
MRKMILLVIGLALISAACRVESHVILTLEPDRSGTYTIEFGMDEELQQAISSFGGLGGEETVDPLEGFEIDDPDVETTRRTEGDMTFVVATSSFQDVDELDSVLASAEDTGVGDLDISYEGDTVTVTGSLVGTGDLNTEGLGDLGGFGDLGDLGDLGALGLDPSALTDDFFSASLIIAMPGEVTEHNATRVRSDGSLEWDLPLDDKAVDVIAVSDTGASSFPWWVVGVVVVLIAAVGLGITLGRRRQQASVQAVQQAQAGAEDQTKGGDPFIQEDPI